MTSTARIVVWAIAVALLCAGAPRARADDDAAARELFEEGNRLLKEGDYEGALINYEAAYALAPRAKIRLNIGAVLLLLGRDAEAADQLAAYLEMPDRDPARVAKVKSELAALDARLGRLALRVELPDAVVTVNRREVGATPLRRTVRVEPGPCEIAVVGEDGEPLRAQSVTVPAGEQREVVIAPEPEPEPPAPDPVREVVPAPADTAAVRVHRGGGGTPAFGVFVRTDIDAAGRGAVVVPGVSLRLTDGFHAFGAALVGRDQGAELGVRAVLGGGWLRALGTAAVPVFFADGTRPGGRASVGAAVVASSWLWLTAEVGASYAPSVPDGFANTVALGSVGVEVGF